MGNVRRNGASTIEVFSELLNDVKAKGYSPAGYSYDVELWDIITALRGPDHINSRRLKDLTTAMIRGFLGFRSGLYIVRIAPLTFEERDERRELLDKASEHFRVHYYRACRAIELLYDYDLHAECPLKKRGFHADLS